VADALGLLEGEFASAFRACEAEAHNVTMSVAYADFERLARPTVADIAMTR
jgi:hypothetical protein